MIVDQFLFGASLRQGVAFIGVVSMATGPLSFLIMDYFEPDINAITMTAALFMIVTGILGVVTSVKRSNYVGWPFLLFLIVSAGWIFLLGLVLADIISPKFLDGSDSLGSVLFTQTRNPFRSLGNRNTVYEPRSLRRPESILHKLDDSTINQISSQIASKLVSDLENRQSQIHVDPESNEFSTTLREYHPSSGKKKPITSHRHQNPQEIVEVERSTEQMQGKFEKRTSLHEAKKAVESGDLELCSDDEEDCSEMEIEIGEEDNSNAVPSSIAATSFVESSSHASPSLTLSPSNSDSSTMTREEDIRSHSVKKYEEIVKENAEKDAENSRATSQHAILLSDGIIGNYKYRQSTSAPNARFNGLFKSAEEVALMERITDLSARFAQLQNKKKTATVGKDEAQPKTSGMATAFLTSHSSALSRNNDAFKVLLEDDDVVGKEIKKKGEAQSKSAKQKKRSDPFDEMEDFFSEEIEDDELFKNKNNKKNKTAPEVPQETPPPAKVIEEAPPALLDQKVYVRDLPPEINFVSEETEFEIVATSKIVKHSAKMPASIVLFSIAFGYFYFCVATFSWLMGGMADLSGLAKEADQWDAVSDHTESDE